MAAEPHISSTDTPPPSEDVTAGDSAPSLPTNILSDEDLTVEALSEEALTEEALSEEALTVEIADEQERLDVDRERITRAIRQVATEAGIERGYLSVAIVDDATIAELHARYLNLDSPTDVLSFVLERDDSRLEGEIVISADTAARVAKAYTGESPNWNATDEMLLYVVHGMLHLVGHDDLEPAAAEQMKAAERRHLADFGLVPPGR